jgi:CO/xanthine dehydrogenase Mo-binding subunit
LYLYCSTQSVARTVDPVARWVGIDAEDIVLVSEYTGGGFGSKGGGAISMAIPALLSKKANAPVMMRIPREDEQHIGRARTGMVGRAKAGFRKDGRITALDLFIVEDNGPCGRWGPSIRGQRGVADLAAARDALARRRRAHQYAAAIALACPGAMQGNGLMERGQGREQAGTRSADSTSTRPKARPNTVRQRSRASAAT